MNKKVGCPGCGGDKFKDNNGVDHSLGHGGLHVLLHSLKHHVHPVMMAVGVLAAVGRMVFPKTLTCTACGHVAKV
jgi:hypothetical protein